MPDKGMNSKTSKLLLLLSLPCMMNCPLEGSLNKIQIRKIVTKVFNAVGRNDSIDAILTMINDKAKNDINDIKVIGAALIRAVYGVYSNTTIVVRRIID